MSKSFTPIKIGKEFPPKKESKGKTSKYFNNEIISGLIFDPIKNELFFAEKNNGAFFNNKRIRVSKKNK